MRIAFVGSNPSQAGSECAALKNLAKWQNVLGVKNAAFFNVSNEVTEDNRPLKKSEYQLNRLRIDLEGFNKLIALGNTASEALTELGKKHFKLPHPSPKNRLLNDVAKLQTRLSECRDYLEESF